MFDRNTLIVSYDAGRGEPRGSRKRGADPGQLGLGDCIDCNICVQVCPTGIDIREGLQYECITCAACIDGCDSVMDKMGYPRGLIRYTTQNTLDGKGAQVFRPRTLIYSALLAVLFGVFLFALFNRDPLTLDVIRDRNAIYREMADGSVENVYTLKLLNKSDMAHEVALEVQGLPGVTLETDPPVVRVEPGSMSSVIARVRVPRDAAAAGGHDLAFRATRVDGEPAEVIRESRFMLPLN